VDSGRFQQGKHDRGSDVEHGGKAVKLSKK